MIDLLRGSFGLTLFVILSLTAAALLVSVAGGYETRPALITTAHWIGATLWVALVARGWFVKTNRSKEDPRQVSMSLLLINTAIALLITVAAANYLPTKMAEWASAYLAAVAAGAGLVVALRRLRRQAE